MKKKVYNIPVVNIVSVKPHAAMLTVSSEVMLYEDEETYYEDEQLSRGRGTLWNDEWTDAEEF